MTKIKKSNFETFLQTSIASTLMTKSFMFLGAKGLLLIIRV
jgi:hypothetical protein